MLLVERIQENLKHGIRQAICMEKPLETAWVDPKVGWGMAPGNHQSGENSVSQSDGISDMVTTCQLCAFMGGGLRKGTVASASTSVWGRAAPSSCPDARQFRSSPCVSNTFLSDAPVLELRESESNKFVCGPFKRKCLGLQKFVTSIASIPTAFTE